jgi:uncharacterized cupredoxin-like copper-binding protein
MREFTKRASAVLAAVLASSAAGCAHSGHDEAAAGATDAARPRSQTFGRGALAAEATRTVEIRLHDDLRFEPSEVTVQRGEVVTFHLVNVGKVPHEFTIGGPNAQELHENQMALMDHSGMPGMEGMHHDDKLHKKYEAGLKERVTELDRVAAASESVHVMPNEAKDLTWAFTGPEIPAFGCHVPGHWGGGMKGMFSAG